MFTEFISSEGLIRDAVKSTKKLDIFDAERPIGIQIFGGNEDSMQKAVEIVSDESKAHANCYFRNKILFKF